MLLAVSSCYYIAQYLISVWISHRWKDCIQASLSTDVVFFRGWCFFLNWCLQLLASYLHWISNPANYFHSPFQRHLLLIHLNCVAFNVIFQAQLFSPTQFCIFVAGRLMECTCYSLCYPGRREWAYFLCSSVLAPPPLSSSLPYSRTLFCEFCLNNKPRLPRLAK